LERKLQYKLQEAQVRQPGAQFIENSLTAIFAQDERVRRMNLLAKEANLRASNVLSGLHATASETQLGQAMTGRFLNLIPLSKTFSDIRGGLKGGMKATKFGAQELV
jgi:hypothetical protein